MSKHTVRTTEGITLEVDVAGPGSRFLAGVLDGLLVVMVLLAVVLGLTVLAELDPTGASTFVQGFLALGFLLGIVAYFVGFHALSDGQTPGKRALGIRVVGVDGEPAGLGALVLRGVLMIPDAVPVPLFLGMIVIAVSPRRQRLGDVMARTLVVRDTRSGARGMEPWAHESWTGLQVRVLELSPASAGRFDGGDLAFLRDVITRRGMEAMRRRAFLQRVARHYQERLGHGAGEDPRAVLRELYLFLREHRATLREA